MVLIKGHSREEGGGKPDHDGSGEEGAAAAGVKDSHPPVAVSSSYSGTPDPGSAPLPRAGFNVGGQCSRTGPKLSLIFYPTS